MKTAGLAATAAIAGALVAGGVQAQSVQLEDRQAVIRFQGMTVLVDPSLDAAPLPPVDLVLLPSCGAAQQAWLARQTLDRAVAVLAGGPCATELRGMGVRHVHVLRLWETFELHKGTAGLRLTAMPGIAQDSVVDAPGAMLDFSEKGDKSYRIYVGGEATPEEIGALPQRFPGADLAIVRRAGTPVLGVPQLARNGEHVLRTVASLPDDGYRFTPLARSSRPSLQTR
ncbi:MAG: hypothetical protein V4724_15120 [Pseudomonadota bacterium]